VRIPEGIPVTECAAGDAFLLATAFGALRRARAIHVHAPVTAGLPESVARLGSLWAERDPSAYRPVEIRADSTVPGVPGSGPALLCYSGGLDSTWSLDRLAGPGASADGPRVGAAVMVRGADIPVEEETAFAAAFAHARAITASRGVPLLEAATNLRVVKQKWSHSYVAAFAAVLNLFRAGYGRGLLAAGLTREEAARWWPQDATDPPLVSSPAFPFEGHGYERDRLGKMEVLRDWAEAREHLRVCYRRGHWTGNCGTCFKCVVARLMARVALGGVPPCLEERPPEDDVRTAATSRDPMILLRFEQIRRHARARGLEAPWLDAIDAVLRDAKRPRPA
jgi:hypothetical protein